MDRPQLPLNALRAFEAAARHLSFTRAAIELCVSQAAVSHQVSGLEERLGIVLFRRLPRGLALTDEGAALVPVLSEAFDRIGAMLDRFVDGRYHEVLTVGVVGTFATGWLLPRIAEFTAANPTVDLRILTNNNRVDLAGEGLDLAIRFGDGAWHGVEAIPLIDVPMTPLCAPALARRLARPGDLAGETLLRSYRQDEWPRWFEAAGADCPKIRGPVFDSSAVMASAAAAGAGVALLPAMMFENELAAERLMRPFAAEIDAGRYWLVRLRSRAESPAMRGFRLWLTAAVGPAKAANSP
ncbi:LysR family transcriptional regulator [Mesorhizobium sp. BAC0120]|uniref:LysR family transcriptional regulator n=1 Tax=Mesorhizobium sp. BAC0120 TaxID=3090670 RepID=UPI00298C9999|nr:LysR family transcriptional regulator [Mesorhizobium sp. BAC0120]MDW6021195.1 LysR family transcriptional regulator [Mesorhizobium sp. BAC0120]